MQLTTTTLQSNHYGVSELTAIAIVSRVLDTAGLITEKESSNVDDNYLKF